MKSLFYTLICGILTFPVFGQSEIETEGLIITPFQEVWITPKTLTFLNDISGYNFYCAPDWHKSEMALEQRKAFITYLHQNKGLEKLVIEFPYVYGYLINEYLQTGDTILLRSVTDRFWSFDKQRADLEISHNSFGFFLWLYDFNSHHVNQIEVVGLDLDESLNGTLELWALQRFLQRDSLYLNFKNSYPELVELVNSEIPKAKTLKKWHSLFRKELIANNSKVKSSLGLDYYDFEKIIVGISDIIDRNNKNGSAKQKHREDVLIRNFKREINPTDVIYAQFGLGHILLHDKYKFDTMLTAVEKDNRYSGRALVIDIHCEMCELGKSRIAHKPWPLFVDEGKGYWGHSSMGFFTNEEHNQFIELLNKQNSIIDLRTTSGKLAELKELYQFMIVLF